MVEGLRVGHKTKNAARRVCEAGDAIGRAVGIGWVGLCRLATFWVHVGHWGEVVGADVFEDLGRGRDELAFAVAHRHLKSFKTLGKDAGRVGVDSKMDPAVFKAGRVVVAEGDLTLESLAIQTRQ